MKFKNISIWQEEKKLEKYPNLTENITCDVLIIGGGITGISTAYQLIDSGLKVCLVEKNEIGQGVTCRTTGKLTYLQENIASKISSYHGFDKAKLYIQSQIDAIKIIKETINKEKISCDLKQTRSYITNNNLAKYNKELNLLKKIGINIIEDYHLPGSKKKQKVFYIEDSYVFHPLKYLYQLAKKCNKKNIAIYENTKVTNIGFKDNHYECVANNYIIKCKKIILALHYPFFLFPYFTPIKTTIEKSYIKAYKTNIDYLYNMITIAKPTLSIRFWENKKNIFKIILGNSHISSSQINDLDNFYQILTYDKEKVDYLWSNKDIITNDSLPFIGEINNNLLIGTGYNTWGMTNGTIAGKLLADIVLKKNNQYLELFNPKRGVNLGNIINFPISIASSTCSFIKSKLRKDKKWYPPNVSFEKRDGKNIAIYIDENKNEHIVYNICPHLKCSLIFNDVEKTWDCPCHGSRFDIDGNCIEGPSNYNITYKN